MAKAGNSPEDHFECGTLDKHDSELRIMTIFAIITGFVALVFGVYTLWMSYHYNPDSLAEELYAVYFGFD